MWRNWNFCTLLVGMYNGAVVTETAEQFSKAKHRINI